jgi:putative hemolysin
MVRVLSIGKYRIGDIMTPRPEVDWIDADDDRDEMLRTIRASRHEQSLVGRGSLDEPMGMVLKADLLDQSLDGQPLDPLAVIREPLIVHEAKPVFTVLEQFKQKPVRLAIILNVYGSLEGIVTQADCLRPSPAICRTWKVKNRISSGARMARS